MNMTESEKRVRDTLDALLPRMSDQEVMLFLVFAEGMAFTKGQLSGTPKPVQDTVRDSA